MVPSWNYMVPFEVEVLVGHGLVLHQCALLHKQFVTVWTLKPLQHHELRVNTGTTLALPPSICDTLVTQPWATSCRISRRKSSAIANLSTLNWQC